MQLQPSRPGVFAGLYALFEGERGTLLSAILAPILIFLALWLPPLSLGDRLFDAGYIRVLSAGGTFSDPDGTQLTVLPEALPSEGTVKVKFSSIPQTDFMDGSAERLLPGAAQALPPDLLTLKSPIYVADVRGPMPLSSLWTVVIPNASEPYSLLDLYGWDGSRWQWLPHKLRVEDDVVESEAPTVPLGVAVVQAQSQPLQVGALSGENPDFLQRAGGTLTLLTPRLYVVQGDGSIGQIFTPSPIFQQSGALVMPVLSNVEPSGVVRSDLVDNLLIDPNTWQRHAERIAEIVLSSSHDGIVLDYRNVDPQLRDSFGQFVTLLGERLSSTEKSLVVRVGEPIRISEDDYNTGAYDWRVIGRAADQVQVPIPRRAGSFAGADDLDALLTYATGHVNRYKLLIELPAAPYTLTADGAVPVPYSEIVTALTDASNTETQGTESLVLPLPALADMGRVTLDPATGSYRFLLAEREVYIEDASSLARRLEQLNGYHIGGILLADPSQADPAIWTTLATVQGESMR